MGLSFAIAAVFASAVILRSEFRGPHDHILLSQIRDSQNWRYIPQEQGGPVIPPGIGFNAERWMFPSLSRLLANRIQNSFYKG
jgi:hypothetical protein